MPVLISIASIAVILGVLVFVHEFGHYAVAKLCGVRVETFSLGFGKRLWGFRRGDTDYRISLLPVGGYVKMAGENPMESRTGDPGEFTSHPRWQRFLIAIAGPAANIILTLVVLTGIFMVHHERPVFADQPATIGWVMDDSAAQHAGLMVADRIVRIQNFQNPTWEDVVDRTFLSPNQPVAVDIQRGQEILHKTVIPKVGRDQTGEVGWIPQAPAMVARIDPKMPAARAGIEAGDELLAINGSENATALSPLLQINKDKPIEVTVLRHGQRMNFTLTPEYVEDPGNPGGKKYRIGIEIGEVMVVNKLPFGEAAALSVKESRKQSGFVFTLLGKMFERPSTVKSFSSPIGMAKFAGQAAMEGLIPILTLMALISLQLALFNLLPIPILDGGLMLMLMIEGIMRRDIKIEIKERVYQVAFVFLMLFAAVVIYNDVIKQLHG
ncbi:MAG TPA: RIP metalloprotease RseP [Candidatus Angelobacter sp.]|nr:RIP metalloprotease RseP [Candidatus Angelobacter sp.]